MVEVEDGKGHFVFYESNIVNVNHNTWWIDQGMENLRRLVGSEQYIYLRGKMSSHVEAIGTCSLVLSNGFILCLEKTF